MSKFEQERITARRILAGRLIAMDQVSDSELEEHLSNDEPVSHTLLRLSEKSKVERAMEELMPLTESAANSDKFLYDDNGLPD